MLGSTNAVIVQGGGGESLVYAINNTGGEVAAGDKVWLNKHNLDENVAYQLENNPISLNMERFIFDNDDNIIVLGQSSSTKVKYTYDPETKTWAESTLTNGFDANAFIRYFDGVAVSYRSTSMGNTTTEYSAIQNENTSFALKGWYLGQGLMISYVSSGNYALKKVNVATGEVGDTVYTFTAGTSSLYSAFLSGNTLFFVTGSNKYFFYNIAGWDNEYFQFTPQLLKEGVLAGLSNNYPIMYATGLSGGNYFIVNKGGSQNNSAPTELIIYKIGADYSIIEATDLQEDLQSFVGQKCYTQYYNGTGILTVGTVDNVYAFKFENGNFTNLNLAMTLPEGHTKYEGAPYFLFLSNDFTSAVIMYRYQTSSYVYTDCGFYKLKTASEEWYADTFQQASALTLTGFATGDSLNGKIEVKTVVK